MNFDSRINWNNIEILKSESHAYRRRIAKSVLINQKARSLNVINSYDGANFPAVHIVLRYFLTQCTCAHPWFYYVIVFLLLGNCLPSK